ncbi:GntR family transcriptional regulator [Mesorhizobium sp. M0659]|uniref:GntR family transcriptional regulator n=1 Tax=Mesorhizobium sp. M0659 TaxID=2956980 RepID=UPI00333AB46F
MKDVGVKGGQPGFSGQLASVGRETVQDRVYLELRRALICGIFESGQVLTVRGLAEVLMTSTMPVREALGRLVAEKALEPLLNRSVRVPTITVERLDDLLRARILVEGEAAALAASRISDAKVADVVKILDQWEDMRTAAGRDVDVEVRLNQTFHFTIYENCGSPTLIPIIESLWLQSGPCTRYAITAATAGGDIDADHYHKQITEALIARDAVKVRELIIADMTHSFGFLREKLKADEARA